MCHQVWGPWAFSLAERKLIRDKYTQKAHLPRWILNALISKMERTALPIVLCPLAPTPAAVPGGSQAQNRGISMGGGASPEQSSRCGGWNWGQGPRSQDLPVSKLEELEWRSLALSALVLVNGEGL